MVELHIKGNYKSFVKLKISKTKIKTDKVVLIVHGLYADTGNPYSKSKLLGNKILKEEADDIIFSIQLILDQSDKLFGIQKEKLRFYIVANSVGGTIISTLKDYFKYFDKIVLCGSGTGSSSSTKPILSTCPPEKVILSSAEAFTGQVLFLQGDKDDVVPLEAQDKLLGSYKNAKAQKIVIKGANHSFSKIDGKNKILARNLYANSIANFLN